MACVIAGDPQQDASDGVRGAAFVEVPCDLGSKTISGMLNGIPFDGTIARRSKKIWLSIESDLAAAARVGAGDEVDVVLAATPLPRSRR
jgi:hypothetical protein